MNKERALDLKAEAFLLRVEMEQLWHFGHRNELKRQLKEWIRGSKQK